MFGKMAFIPSKGYFHSFEEANVDKESFGKFLIPQSPSSLLQDNHSAQSTVNAVQYIVCLSSSTQQQQQKFSCSF